MLIKVIQLTDPASVENAALKQMCSLPRLSHVERNVAALKNERQTHLFVIADTVSGPTLLEYLTDVSPVMGVTWGVQAMLDIIEGLQQLEYYGVRPPAVEPHHVRFIHPGRGAQAVLVGWLESVLRVDHITIPADGKKRSGGARSRARRAEANLNDLSVDQLLLLGQPSDPAVKQLGRIAFRMFAGCAANPGWTGGEVRAAVSEIVAGNGADTELLRSFVAMALLGSFVDLAALAEHNLIAEHRDPGRS